MHLRLAVYRFRWWVDPGRGWLGGWFGRLSDEALGIFSEGGVQNDLAGGMDGVGLAIMDLVRGHETDANVVVILIVPGEEAPAERLGVLDASEALGEIRLIFQGLEMAFREGIVVGGMGAAVGFGDAQIGEQLCGGLGLHRAAAIGMQGELARRDVVLRVCPETLLRTQSPQHKADHGEPDEGERRFQVLLMVANEAAAAGQPRERALDNPPLW